MALDLSEADHMVLETFLEMVLNEFRHGNLTRMEARDIIAKAFTQATSDNGNVVDFLESMIHTLKR